jgi:hypothetical protein
MSLDGCLPRHRLLAVLRSENLLLVDIDGGTLCSEVSQSESSVPLNIFGSHRVSIEMNSSTAFNGVRGECSASVDHAIFCDVWSVSLGISLSAFNVVFH